MPGNMPSKPIAGLFTLSNIVTLFAIVIMLRLGYWQLQRAEEKQQLLSVNETRRGGASVDIAHLDRLQGDRNDYPVTLSGYFLEEYFCGTTALIKAKWATRYWPYWGKALPTRWLI